jgi:FkbM family methyltransferase
MEHLWGRSSARLLHGLSKLHILGWHFIKTLFLVKRPLSFIFHYITLRLPSSRLIEFRNGTRIHISSNSNDLATVFLMFIRRDYGAIAKGSRILDIGANIGTFAIYALQSGATQVYSYEPCREAYELLCKNLEVNKLVGHVKKFRLAVSDKEGEMVPFPISSDPANRMGVEWATGLNYDLVPTTTVRGILAENQIEAIDLAKIDCEGAEYPIVQATPDEVWSRIREIKMEYHAAQTDLLIGRLTGCGYSLVQRIAFTARSGQLWLRQR